MATPISIDSKQIFDELFNEIDTVLVDCDGVVYLEHNPIPGAADVLKLLRSRGKKVIFASNNASRARTTVLANLNRMGFEATLEEVITATFLVGAYLKKQNFVGLAYVLGCKGLKDEMDLAGIRNVGVGPDPFPANIDPEVESIPEMARDPYGPIGAVVIAYDNLISLPKLMKTCTYMRKVDPQLVVATDLDGSSPDDGSGWLIPGTAPFASFCTSATGIKPVFVGKPSRHFWEGVKSIYPNLDPKRSLIFGDRLNTDIEFGNTNGLRATILVGTGVHKLEDAKLAEGLQVPSHYIAGLAQLKQFLV